MSVVMAPAKGAIVRSFDNPLKGDVQCRSNFLNAPLVRKEERDGVSAGATLAGISFEFLRMLLTAVGPPKKGGGTENQQL